MPTPEQFLDLLANDIPQTGESIAEADYLTRPRIYTLMPELVAGQFAGKEVIENLGIGAIQRVMAQHYGRQLSDDLIHQFGLQRQWTCVADVDHRTIPLLFFGQELGVSFSGVENASSTLFLDRALSQQQELRVSEVGVGSVLDDSAGIRRAVGIQFGPTGRAISYDVSVAANELPQGKDDMHGYRLATTSLPTDPQWPTMTSGFITSRMVKEAGSVGTGASHIHAVHVATDNWPHGDDPVIRRKQSWSGLSYAEQHGITLSSTPEAITLGFTPDERPLPAWQLTLPRTI